MSSKILLPEDKKYLRTFSRYLNSLGIEEGEIFFYSANDGIDDMEINRLRYFENSRTAEVTNELKKILIKIISNFDIGEIDGSDYHSVIFKIDTTEKKVFLIDQYGISEPSDTQSNSWDLSDDDEIGEIFEEISGLYSDKSILELEYNGSGDSGYIESSFTNGERVPSDVENWCYNALENLHGGWEINEGSQGKFLFNIKDKIIELYHSYNEMSEEEYEIFSESFTN